MPSSERQEEEMRQRGYITVTEAAERLRVGIGVVYHALKTGSLKEVRVGRRRYVEFESFRTYAGPLAGD